ncbi:MAG: linked oxidase, C-terminal domain, partial [Actinomycetota bacterium]
GIAKVHWLARLKGEPTLAALWAVKRGLDPHNLMNPGVLY